MPVSEIVPLYLLPPPLKTFHSSVRRKSVDQKTRKQKFLSQQKHKHPDQHALHYIGMLSKFVLFMSDVILKPDLVNWEQQKRAVSKH